MASSIASRRYAKALLLLAAEANQADAVLKELDGVRATIAGSSDLRAVLGSPVIKPEKKGAVVKAVFPSSSDLVSRVIDLLAERQKLSLLPDIALTYIQLYNEANGIAEVLLTSAEPLTDELTLSVKTALERKTGKKVNLRSSVDPSLIGGITVQIGDTMFDGSVRHSLEKLDMLLHAPIA